MVFFACQFHPIRVNSSDKQAVEARKYLDLIGFSHRFSDFQFGFVKSALLRNTLWHEAGLSTCAINRYNPRTMHRRLIQ